MVKQQSDILNLRKVQDKEIHYQPIYLFLYLK